LEQSDARRVLAFAALSALRRRRTRRIVRTFPFPPTVLFQPSIGRMRAAPPILGAAGFRSRFENEDPIDSAEAIVL
jgi:hypothetical protein